MRVEIIDKIKVATPSEGMWLSNGDVVSDSVYMPIGADESAWVEISEEEKEKREAEMLAELESQSR